MSLFTNIPLHETINITADLIYNNTNHSIPFDKETFIQLLNLATLDTHFFFNDSVYEQIDGVAMGSPLAPTLANIFLNHMEHKYLSPTNNLIPSYYKRYVDDTFLLFNNTNDAHTFFDYINTIHPNLRFTMETENNNSLSFLDTLITRTHNSFETSVYRKATFTGQGCHFYSHCSLLFKTNTCKTLIHRAYKICSNYFLFHKEISFLEKFFTKNGFSKSFFYKQVHKYIYKRYQPTNITLTVPKDKRYFVLPFLGDNTNPLKQDLITLLNRHYSYIDFNLIFTNTYTIGSFFKIKDSLCSSMRSSVVYQYTCPHCQWGKYVGSTSRLLRVRMAEHMGISFRSGLPLNTKMHSSIRDHVQKHKKTIQQKDFKILHEASHELTLHILESICIKNIRPSLNKDLSSLPLYII